MQTLNHITYKCWELSPKYDGTEVSYNNYHTERDTPKTIHCDEFSVYRFIDNSCIVWYNNKEPEFYNNIYGWLADNHKSLDAWEVLKFLSILTYKGGKDV